MSDETNTSEAPSEGSTPPTPSNGNITLSRDEYSQMVGNMAQMQAFIEAVQQQASQSQAPTPQAQVDPNDIDRLSNSQMLGLIGRKVNQLIADSTQPVLQAVMTLSVKEEMREVQGEFDDFKDFKKDVYEIASKNSTLSLRDAYLIAKANKSGKALPNDVKMKLETPTSSAPTPKATSGERPGVGVSSLKTQHTMSVRDAAAEALKELKYE